MENITELMKYTSKIFNQQEEVYELLRYVLLENEKLKKENQELKGDLYVLENSIKIKDIIIKENNYEILHLRNLRDKLIG